MTDEEKEQMAHYGVTAVQETVYLFSGYKYRDLNDALNYAKLLARLNKEKEAEPNSRFQSRR